MLGLSLGLLLASGSLSSGLSTRGTYTAQLPVATISNKANRDSKTVFVGRTLSEFDQDVFLGIKYADEPTRFTPSELKTKYTSNDSNSGPLSLNRVGLTSSSGSVFYNATQYGYDCPAYGSDTTKLVNMGLAKLNEDCLNLNIIRPKTESEELLPVMLWIFGGGWQQGATADPRYVNPVLRSYYYSFLRLAII